MQVPDGQRPLKGGFAVAFGDGLSATLDRPLAVRLGLGKRFKPGQALRACGLTAI
ncbi:hypothetical protein [Phenylobacterium sp. Root700]|uniref:hypothetical protein n=1 Tax=Phenylobacterium sp. Root700 TaxID=1736591 RepID=UPI000B115508|nr:hypothetical protein [Phenylobacterium sp. Root700]